MNKILVVLFASMMLFSCANQKAITQKHADHIDLMENEELLMAVRAQYLGKLFTQPGRLFLTNKRIYFRTSKLATKKQDFSVYFNDVSEVKKAGYNLKLGTASINAFKLNLKDDTKIIFVTPKKKRWISEINKLLLQ